MSPSIDMSTLFSEVGEEKRVHVRDFLLEVRKSEIAKYRVRRITHVKNLRSFWSHEYLQIVVENSSGNRERLVAERQAEQDQVVINRFKKSSAGTSSSTPDNRINTSLTNPSEDSLPLPLVSLKSIDGMTLENLSLILLLVSQRAPIYNFFHENCYWYARGVYESLKACFHCVEKRWRWAHIRGRPIVFREIRKRDALDFMNKMGTKSPLWLAAGMDYARSPEPWIAQAYNDATFFTDSGDGTRNEDEVLNKEQINLASTWLDTQISAYDTKDAEILQKQKYLNQSVREFCLDMHIYALQNQRIGTPKGLPVEGNDEELQAGEAVIKLQNRDENALRESIEILVGCVLEDYIVHEASKVEINS